MATRRLEEIRQEIEAEIKAKQSEEVTPMSTPEFPPLSEEKSEDQVIPDRPPETIAVTSGLKYRGKLISDMCVGDCWEAIKTVRPHNPLAKRHPDETLMDLIRYRAALEEIMLENHRAFMPVRQTK